MYNLTHWSEQMNKVVENKGPSCYPINTQNLKTAWKRSESKESFRQWCKSRPAELWLDKFVKSLCKKYEITHMELTTKADRLTNMKIKTIFEPKDFEGSGQAIVRNSFEPKSDNVSFGASVAYKIGYERKDSGTQRCLLISLSDGMTRGYASKQALCDHLNTDVVGFRVLAQYELEAITKHVGNRFFNLNLEKK